MPAVDTNSIEDRNSTWDSCTIAGADGYCRQDYENLLALQQIRISKDPRMDIIARFMIPQKNSFKEISVSQIARFIECNLSRRDRERLTSNSIRFESITIGHMILFLYYNWNDICGEILGHPGQVCVIHKGVRYRIKDTYHVPMTTLEEINLIGMPSVHVMICQAPVHCHHTSQRLQMLANCFKEFQKPNEMVPVTYFDSIVLKLKSKMARRRIESMKNRKELATGVFKARSCLRKLKVLTKCVL